MHRAWRRDAVMGERGKLCIPRPRVMHIRVGAKAADQISYFESGVGNRASCRWAKFGDWNDVLKSASFIEAWKTTVRNDDAKSQT